MSEVREEQEVDEIRDAIRAIREEVENEHVEGSEATFVAKSAEDQIRWFKAHGIDTDLLRDWAMTYGENAMREIATYGRDPKVIHTILSQQFAAGFQVAVSLMARRDNKEVCNGGPEITD